MEFLLNNLIDHLGNKLPWAVTVDEDYGQLENLLEDNADMYPLTYPAVLIEPTQTEWSDVAAGAQKGAVTLRIRLIVDCYDDTHYGSTTTQNIEQRQELCKQLHNALQLHRTEDGSGLIRTRSRHFTFAHGIKVYESHYTCTITEHVEKPTLRITKPSPVVLLESR